LKIIQWKNYNKFFDFLQTPGLRIRQDRINAACAKYGSDENEKSLINLIEVTNIIGMFDRTKLFNELLQLYCKLILIRI